MSVNEKMTTIADTIRAYTDGTEKLGLDEMAQQVQTVYLSGVYDAAYQSGHDAGHEVGYTAGQQAEHDRFWDAYQQNGEKRNYECAFAGFGWQPSTFTPKYHIIASVSAYMMFRYAQINVDLVEHLSNLGITMSTAGCSNFQYAFYGATVTRLGELDLRSALYLQSAFAQCARLKTIDKIISAESTSYDNSTFSGCTALESISFDGAIGKNISFSNSNLLTVASIQSIIDHLADLTGKTAQTLTFHADVGAKLTDEQKAAITAKNWTLVY